MASSPIDTAIQNLTTRANNAETRLRELEENLQNSITGICEPIVVKDGIFPEWAQPAGSPASIMVMNSLCPSELVPFIPNDGQTIRWYQCGPTVYAPSHAGHARAYVTFDIMRRLMADYFSFNVKFVQNITDVDDKIIKRARQNHLVENYLDATENPEVIRADIMEAFQQALAKHDKSITERMAKEKDAKGRQKKTLGDQITNERLKRANTERDLRDFEQQDTLPGMLNYGSAHLAEKLDRELGGEVMDQTIFRAHAQKFEIEYVQDMRALNVRDPDVVTRVTEYVDDIMDYVQRIVDNGYAYESNGSVYFDTVEFQKTHNYGKLCPQDAGSNLELLLEGEGDIEDGAEKKRPQDFALWKLSKRGEPMWQSPWGSGRPGWHIECSCMASDTLGDTLDIHTGGEDLKFPHHDNSMAQAEAYFSNPSENYYHQQWINYWFHAGHLHIKGLKMSKSLKNFVSIREMLEDFSCRQVRILFSLQTWHAKMLYNDDTLKECLAKEKALIEFFLTVRSYERELKRPEKMGSIPQRWSDADRALDMRITQAMTEVDTHFRNNFDYPEAMRSCFNLIKDINLYLTNAASPKCLLLTKAAEYINNILNVLGIVMEGDSHFLGNRQDTMETALTPIIDVICKARNDVVNVYRTKGTLAEAQEVANEYLSKVAELQETSNFTDSEISDLAGTVLDSGTAFLTGVMEADNLKVILSLSDVLRDDDLFNVGIALEDVMSLGTSVWKLYYPASILVSGRNAEILEKKENQRAQRVKDLEALIQQRDCMQSFEKSAEEVKALSKNAGKKYKKEMGKRKKKFKKFQAKVEKNPNLIAEMEAEIATLDAEVFNLRSVWTN